ncbi:MAG TPA: hypothetical protein ENH82_12915 [bacterium]|nr:hypothetical protein [bacterium]
MYMITEMLDGGWCGIYQIQDGTDRFEVNTRKDAVDEMIRSVKIMNHMDITEDDMEFGQEKEKVKDMSVTREDARMQTIDVLINAMDDLHLANLKLRVALDVIAHMPYVCSDAKRVATEALR